MDAIKALKEAEGDVEAKDNCGSTPMHIAAWSGKVEAIKVLKEAGGDVEAKDNYGGTPIQRAAWRGKVGAIKALNEVGGDVSARNATWRTPASNATLSGSQNGKGINGTERLKKTIKRLKKIVGECLHIGTRIHPQVYPL